ncbi:AhpC/TSA family protein [Chitinophaga silvatica]|uniref:AhpC/TSA family protein n=1 Tax=Chitinophaga silvatica TaxID=2282649 RepID=A0A3E1YBH8_9BACT|nr:TlpA disulfide reductase family protein [Chitinophaga silvatica]RFS23351.1 AhpC/TSA family protein [Chitinophaga silvatica]
MKVSRLLSVAALLAYTGVNAGVGPVPIKSPSIIQGKVTNDQIRKVTLYAVVEGRKEEIATAKLNDQQAFAFAVPSPKEGFYYVSTGIRGGDARIYLKPGDNLSLIVEDGEYSLQSGSAENKVLQQWSRQLKPLTMPIVKMDTSTFQSYFPKLEALVAQVKSNKQKVATPNKAFNEMMKLQMDLDVERTALQFLLMPHSIHPSPDQYPAYYKQILQPNKYSDSRILRDGDASSLLSLYGTYSYMNQATHEKIKPEERLARSVALYGNDTVKAVVITQSLDAYKSYDALIAAMEPVKQYLVTDEQNRRYLEFEKKLHNFAAGKPALSFSGEDVNGKKVSLADFKGKVVVVDVWATWCGPCKAELPYLMKLEEEMHGKDVVFLGSSVDEVKDKQKWLDFVKEKEMKGVQIFTKGYSELTKLYNIQGIPQFMVFDQKGNIVTIDAPRPSTPELKALIEKILTKG